MGRKSKGEKGAGYKSYSPSVKRAFQIMELLVQQKVSLTDISKTLSIPISTTSNILNTMVMMGYVKKDSSGFYGFTNKIIKLTQGFMSKDDNLQSIAKPYMERLVSITKETCKLGIMLEDTYDVLYIEKVDSPLPVSLRSYIGATLPSYSTAIGKAILCSLDKDELDDFFAKKQMTKQTPYTITGKEELLRDLRQIGRQVYAMDNMESLEEVRCIAAPICDCNKEVIAAISISGPVSRMSDARVEEYVPLVVEYADKISLMYSSLG